MNSHSKYIYVYYTYFIGVVQIMYIHNCNVSMYKKIIWGWCEILQSYFFLYCYVNFELISGLWSTGGKLCAPQLPNIILVCMKIMYCLIAWYIMGVTGATKACSKSGYDKWKRLSQGMWLHWSSQMVYMYMY